MRSKKEILEKPEKLGFLFLLLHCEKAHKTTAKLFPRGSPHRKQKRHEKQEPAGGSRWDAGPRAGPAEAEPVSAALSGARACGPARGQGSRSAT